MEPSLIITLIVTFIAIVPGIWAIIYQLKNDKNREEIMQMTLSREMEQLRADEWLDSHRPLYLPIIEKKQTCKYCRSILDNSEKYCPKCGAPTP